MLRRLHAIQPESFAFTPANLEWAKGQITKYPEGRQASAIIPLLWRAQEQEGWLSRPAIEYVANLLGLAYIRALEVATFYFMFQLQPVGSVANIQICGTTTCMICGAEDLVAVCKELIASKPHTLSADGKFSWEEVECLGSCSNAPMAQIGKDYYEDLTPEILRDLIGRFSKGEVPVPGPQNGRYAAEPLSGLTTLKDFESGKTQYNASVQLAVDIHDTVKRIDGTEVPLLTPWTGKMAAQPDKPTPARGTPVEPKPAMGLPADKTGITVQEAPVVAPGKPEKPGRATGGTAKAEPGAPTATATVKTDAQPLSTTTLPKTPAKAADALGIAAVPPKTTRTRKTPASTGVLADAMAAAGAPKKPRALKAARKGAGDDLKAIEGIGPKLEALLHSLGVFHFDQIANWTEAEIAWVDDNLQGFRGRVTRDKWVAQAKLILEVGMEEFLRRAKTNDY